MDTHDTIARFIAGWLQWVEAGAQELEGSPFQRNEGLCICLIDWATLAGFDVIERSKLSSRFYHALGRQHVPFNTGEKAQMLNLHSYCIESARKQCHTNPLRLKWAREYLEQHNGG